MVSELIPIADMTSVGDCPNIRVALDVDTNDEHDADNTTVRVVGTVLGYFNSSRAVILVKADEGPVIRVDLSDVVRGFWAPVGYRPA